MRTEAMPESSSFATSPNTSTPCPPYSCLILIKSHRLSRHGAHHDVTCPVLGSSHRGLTCRQKCIPFAKGYPFLLKRNPFPPKTNIADSQPRGIKGIMLSLQIRLRSGNMFYRIKLGSWVTVVALATASFSTQAVIGAGYSFVNIADNTASSQFQSLGFPTINRR